MVHSRNFPAKTKPGTLIGSPGFLNHDNRDALYHTTGVAAIPNHVQCTGGAFEIREFLHLRQDPDAGREWRTEPDTFLDWVEFMDLSGGGKIRGS